MSTTTEKASEDRAAIEAIARRTVRDCGGDLNEAMTVALRRLDDAALTWGRYGDGQRAALLAEAAAEVRELERMMSDSRSAVAS